MTNLEIYTLPTNQLQPNPFQPRAKVNPDEINELVMSVKVYGILEPIVVAETPVGYQIIAGERRWRAAKKVGLETVPVVVKRTTPQGMLEMALIENVQRVNLNALERAQAFQQLTREFNHTAAELAKQIGKSESYVSNTKKLLRLPDAIKDGLLGGLIQEGHARALASINDEKTAVAAYKILLKEGGTVRRAEELSRKFKKQDGQGTDTRGRSTVVESEEIDNWREKIESVFNKKAQVKLKRSNKVTKITITLKGNVDETQKDLEKILSLAEN